MKHPRTLKFSLVSDVEQFFTYSILLVQRKKFLWLIIIKVSLCFANFARTSMLICCDFKVIVTCVSDPKLYGGGFDVFPIQETTVIYIDQCSPLVGKSVFITCIWKLLLLFASIYYYCYLLLVYFPSVKLLFYCIWKQLWPKVIISVYPFGCRHKRAIVTLNNPGSI